MNNESITVIPFVTKPSLLFWLSLEPQSSEKEMAFLLKGYTPVFLNPAAMFAGVIALSQATRKITLKLSLLITFPGFLQ